MSALACALVAGGVLCYVLTLDTDQGAKQNGRTDRVHVQAGVTTPTVVIEAVKPSPTQHETPSRQTARISRKQWTMTRAGGRAVASSMQRTRRGSRAHTLELLTTLSPEEIEAKPLLRAALEDLRNSGKDPAEELARLQELKPGTERPALPRHAAAQEADFVFTLTDVKGWKGETAEATVRLMLNRFPGPNNFAFVLNFDQGLEVVSIQALSVLQATKKTITFKNQAAGRALVSVTGSRDALSPGLLCKVNFLVKSHTPKSSPVSLTNVGIMGQPNEKIFAQGATLNLRERS